MARSNHIGQLYKGGIGKLITAGKFESNLVWKPITGTTISNHPIHRKRLVLLEVGSILWNLRDQIAYKRAAYVCGCECNKGKNKGRRSSGCVGWSLSRERREGRSPRWRNEGGCLRGSRRGRLSDDQIDCARYGRRNRLRRRKR